MINPLEYISQFDDLPYIVSVAVETMGLGLHALDQAGFSPAELTTRAESAIFRYPVHAIEIGLVAMAMLADGFIPHLPDKRVMREQFIRIGDAIQSLDDIDRPLSS